MATLTVWKFDDPTTADEVRARLLELELDEAIDVHDAVVVSWPEHAEKPQTKQLSSATPMATTAGALWGFLLGAIFFVPLFGAAFGAAMGAASGALHDFGIDDHFIETVRERVTPGTSALFVLTSDADRERVAAQLPDVSAELIATSLGVDDEQAVAELFRGDDP